MNISELNKENLVNKLLSNKKTHYNINYRYREVVIRRNEDVVLFFRYSPFNKLFIPIKYYIGIKQKRILYEIELTHDEFLSLL